MSHTVTVTRLPDETSDDTEYEFGGTHDGNCETYIACNKDWHRHPDISRYGDDEWGTKRAGPHMRIDGSWMVENLGGCALRYVFESEPPGEVLEGIAVGETRHVDLDWDGDDWHLEVHESTPTRPEGAESEQAR